MITGMAWEIPDPLSATTWELPPAESRNCSVPVRGPGTPGTKLTCTVHEAPGTTVPQSFPVAAKLGLTRIPCTTTAELPLFTKVIGFEGLAEPTEEAAKRRFCGLTMTNCAPVPVPDKEDRKSTRLN